MTLQERFIKAKRALFDKLYSALNPQQREAVYTVNGPLLVLAGAGSGKTTVLVKRIAHIIKYGDAYLDESLPDIVNEEVVSALENAISYDADMIAGILESFAVRPCPAWAILSITFTNKAANEMKERLGKMFDDPEIPKAIWAGTFHSICMRILRKYGDRLGYNDNLTIYDTDDTKKLLTAIMKEQNIDEKSFTVKSVAGVISKAKESLLDPDGYEQNSKMGFREKIYARIYREYQKRMEASNALDFDDIIMQTVFLLRDNEDVRKYYAGKFRYICVDEYQDTNPAQFALCSLFASEWRNIMVVGDDDQSIYRFRGATIENILSFDTTYPDARVIKLEQNYRSTKTILDAANAVIGKNTDRRPKTLWTENGSGKKIVLEECEDEAGEARRISDLILKLVAEKKYSYRDFAVLYRVNAQANTIERTFAKSALPYRIYGGVRFGDRKEIKDVVAYLQLINNPADRVRLKRIINEPKRKIGEVTLNAVESIAEETGKTMFEVMREAYRHIALSRSAHILVSFAEMIDGLRKMLDDGCPLDAFVTHVLERSGYRQMLIDGGEAEQDRLDNVDEFVSGVIEYMKNNEEPTLTGFLEETALVADVDRFDETADAVVLMTIHSAKGLEFPVAIIPGLEEGIFPGTQSMNDPGELEEERRLAYVAITRAKKELFLFHSGRRLLYGRTMYNPVSRFVEDIPAELIDEKLKKKEKPSEYSWGNYTGGAKTYIGGSSSGGAMRPVQRPGTAPAGTVQRPAATVKTAPIKKPALIFAPGDRVKHLAFGEGEIISAKQMGSDIMYEVVFDNVGTKKLMATYAKLTKA